MIAFNLKVMAMNQSLIHHHRFADQLHTLPNASSKFFGVAGGVVLPFPPACDGDGVVVGKRPEFAPALTSIKLIASFYCQHKYMTMVHHVTFQSNNSAEHLLWLCWWFGRRPVRPLKIHQDLWFGQGCHIHQSLLFHPSSQIGHQPLFVLLVPCHSNGSSVGQQDAKQLGSAASCKILTCQFNLKTITKPSQTS